MEQENTSLIVCRADRNKNYKVINLTCVADKRLSWKAKGIHNYLITRPENWEVIKGDLIGRSTDGPTSFYSGMIELVKYKYVFRMAKKNEKKQFVKRGYYTVEVPISIEEAMVQIEAFGWEISQKDPDQENPDTGFPDQENQPLTKNKEITKDKNVTTASKEADGSAEPSVGRSISFTNLRPIKTSPYRNFTEEAKELFLYWNSLGDPLPHHEARTSKIFTRSLEGLDLLLKRKYTLEEIKQSMANYKWLLTSIDGLKINRAAYGAVVVLSEFLEFSKFAIDKIRGGNKEIIKNGVTSWFVECLNTREVLEARWSRLQPDEYPAETKKLKELWKEFGGRKLDLVNDENIFRKISIKAHTYFEKLNGKYQWGIEERYPIARLHYLFDVGQAEGWDWRKAKPEFLLSPKMFSEKLPAHWERIAMADTTTSPEMRSKMERDNNELMEHNSHFSWDANSTREKTMAKIAAQRTNKKKEETAEELRDY